MALPKAVKRQAEQARKLAEQAVAAQQNDDSESNEDRLNGLANGQSAENDRLGGEDELELTPIQPDTGAEIGPLREELRIANERYQTLQRKYDVEVPRMAKEIRALKEELDEARQGQESAPETPAEVEQMLQELENDFPSDLVRGLSKAFQKQIEAISKPKREPKGERDDEPPAPSVADQVPRDEVAERMARMEDQLKQSQLTALVKNWRQINDSNEFRAFLATRGTSGNLRNDEMNDAYRRGDIDAVAEVFNAFIREHRGARGSATRQNLEPDGMSTAPNRVDGGEQAVTEADIAEVANKVARAGTRAERDKFTALHRKLVDRYAKQHARR